MALIGYARVSTEDQTLASQREALSKAGCDRVYEEYASGADTSRPVLAKLLRQVGAGDTVVVVRIDRLGRSLSHLLRVIEKLEQSGAFFRSLTDPIDTASVQGKFVLQILGAAAEFERSLIRERTIAGLKQARSEGRVGGNPRLKRRDPEAIREISESRKARYFESINRNSEEWLPFVQRLRPETPWRDVVRILNAALPAGSSRWTEERLKRAAHRFVDEGLLDPNVLERSKGKPKSDRLLAIIAGLVRGNPDLTLSGIALHLEKMREPTPRGQRRWYPSSVAALIQRAEKMGYLEPRSTGTNQNTLHNGNGEII